MNQHEKDYDELAEIVKNYSINGTFTSLYYSPPLGMENHNYSGYLFDVNFKSICATIKKLNNKPILSNRYEVYDHNGVLILEVVKSY